jgi:hypothetical protein
VFDWLLARVENYGVARVVWAPVAVIATVAGVASAFANDLTAGVIVALAILTFAMAVLLLVSREQVRRMGSAQREMREAITPLRAYVVNELPTEAQTALWRDWQEIGKNGDTFSRAEVSILVEGERPLHFVQGQDSGEPLTARERRRVQFTARREPDGVRLPVDWEWTSDSSFRYWIHFSRPISPGDQITYSYEYMWPHTLPELARKGVEHLTWVTERPTKKLEFDVRVDAALGSTAPLKVAIHGIPQTDLVHERDGSGWSFKGTAIDLPKDHEIHLDLDAS